MRHTTLLYIKTKLILDSEGVGGDEEEGEIPQFLMDLEEEEAVSDLNMKIVIGKGEGEEGQEYHLKLIFSFYKANFCHQ